MSHPLRGIMATTKRDLSFRLEIFGGFLLVLILGWLWPVSQVELFAILITYGLVLVAELTNTALEAALDKLHPEQHESIRISKDAAAGAVLIAVCLNVTVVALVILARFGVSQ